MVRTAVSYDVLVGRAKESLTAQDTIDRLYDCYLETYSQLAPAQADSDAAGAIRAQVEAALLAQRVTPESLSRTALKKVIGYLDADFDLEAHPEIYDAHLERIDQLLRQMPMVVLL